MTFIIKSDFFVVDRSTASKSFCSYLRIVVYSNLIMDSEAITQSCLCKRDNTCCNEPRKYTIYPLREYVIERIPFPTSEILVDDKYKGIIFNVVQRDTIDSLTVRGSIRYIKFLNFLPRVSRIILPEVEEIEIICRVDESVMQYITQAFENAKISIHVNEYNLYYLRNCFMKSMPANRFPTLLDLSSFITKDMTVKIENDGNFGEVEISLPEHLKSFRLEDLCMVSNRRVSHLPIFTIPSSLTKLEIKTSDRVSIKNIKKMKDIKELSLEGTCKISEGLLNSIAGVRGLNLERLYVRTAIYEGLFESLSSLTRKAREVRLEFLHLDDRTEYVDSGYLTHYTLTMSPKLENLYVKSMYTNVVILAENCPASAVVRCRGVFEEAKRLNTSSEVQNVFFVPENFEMSE